VTFKGGLPRLHSDLRDGPRSKPPPQPVCNFLKPPQESPVLSATQALREPPLSTRQPHSVGQAGKISLACAYRKHAHFPDLPWSPCVALGPPLRLPYRIQFRESDGKQAPAFVRSFHDLVLPPRPRVRPAPPAKRH
jgi:hypothetical protein